MKDSEFIELLNLYLDHEISAPDAARLEAEVQANPARRKLYQNYCRMQKACKVLAADFHTDEAGAAEAADRKVVAFNPVAAAAAGRQKRVRGFYAAGGFAAAAACLAFIFVNRHEPAAPAKSETVVQATVAPAVNQAAARAAVASSPAPRGGIVIGSIAEARPATPTFVGNPLLLSGAPANALLTSARPDADAQFDWIQKLQITPLQLRTPAEELRFDTRSTTLQPVARTLGGNRSDATAESAAWQIRR